MNLKSDKNKAHFPKFSIDIRSFLHSEKNPLQAKAVFFVCFLMKRAVLSHCRPRHHHSFYEQLHNEILENCFHQQKSFIISCCKPQSAFRKRVPEIRTIDNIIETFFKILVSKLTFSIYVNGCFRGLVNLICFYMCVCMCMCVWFGFFRELLYGMQNKYLSYETISVRSIQDWLKKASLTSLMRVITRALMGSCFLSHEIRSRELKVDLIYSEISMFIFINR